MNDMVRMRQLSATCMRAGVVHHHGMNIRAGERGPHRMRPASTALCIRNGALRTQIPVHSLLLLNVRLVSIDHRFLVGWCVDATRARVATG